MQKRSFVTSLISFVLLAQNVAAFQPTHVLPSSLRSSRTSFLGGPPSLAIPKWRVGGESTTRSQIRKNPLDVKAAIDLALAVTPALNAVSGTVTKFSGAAVLCGVVAFHEAGHFLAARLQGIRVNDFCIGFGPKLLAFKDKEGIEYSLRALPLGGYVSFPEVYTEEKKGEEEGAGAGDKEDEDEIQYSEDDPDLIQNRPALQRALVISGGVVFNMILAWMALFGTVSTNGISNVVLNPGVVIPAITDVNGAGAKYGLQEGDIILKVDKLLLGNSETATTDVSTAIKNSKGAQVHIVLERKGSPMDLDVIPNVDRRGDGVIGVRLSPNVKSLSVEKPKSIGEAVGATNKQFGTLFGQTASGFGKLVSNFAQTSSNLAGPVGVMQMGAEAGKQGALLSFTALISLNLGLMNALPLPALDGGQLLLVMVEAARGKPLNQEVARSVNGAFLALLLCLSLTLLLGDIERLIPSSLFK